MSRSELALNVAGLDEAIVFYSKIFGTGPAKVWEFYSVLADAPAKAPMGACSTPSADSAEVPLSIGAGSTSACC